MNTDLLGDGTHWTIRWLIPAAVAGFTTGLATTMLLGVNGLLSGGADLADPCPVAGAAALVPQDRPNGWTRRDHARCEATWQGEKLADHTEFSVRVDRDPSGDGAASRHLRGCKTLEGLGAVRRPAGLGGEACAVTVAGRVPDAVVLVRKDTLRVQVRYRAGGKDAATVQRNAEEAARQVTARP